MILIVGGEGAGKKTFAGKLGYEAGEMADACVNELPVIFHVERMVLACPENAEALYEILLKKEVVICNEVGSGVIPLDLKDRLGREAVGRLCIRLAQQADAVVRVVCGIPSVIKGSLPENPGRGECL